MLLTARVDPSLGCLMDWLSWFNRLRAIQTGSAGWSPSPILTYPCPLDSGFRSGIESPRGRATEIQGAADMADASPGPGDALTCLDALDAVGTGTGMLSEKNLSFPPSESSLAGLGFLPLPLHRRLPPSLPTHTCRRCKPVLAILSSRRGTPVTAPANHLLVRLHALHMEHGSTSGTVHDCRCR